MPECNTWKTVPSYKQERAILKVKLALKMQNEETLHDTIIEHLIIEGLELPYN